MDDKTKAEENQFQAIDNQAIQDVPEPIFTAEPTNSPENVEKPVEDIQPEEISPDVDLPTEGAPPSTLPPEEPPPIYEENKSKYLIIIGGIIFFILVFLFIFKTILGGKKSTKEIKLTYWGLWEDAQVFEPLIKEYQQKNNNIKITYEKMSAQENYLQKLLVRTKKATGPDIFRFHNTWLPEIKEIIAPLPSNILNNTDFNKIFYPVMQKDLKIGNYYYGLPIEIDGLVLICNEELFKKAGIEVMPSNWEQVLDSAAKLTVKDSSGKIITSGIAIGTASNVEHFSEIFGWMLLQNGGDIKKLDQKEAVSTLESYRRFAEPPNNYWDDNMPNSITAFIEGKAAMIIAPSWEILNIKATSPDIKIKVVPLPVVPGAKAVSLASYWVEGVSKYSKNQIESWKFLDYLINKGNLTKLYEIEAKSRLFGEPYSRVDLASTLVQNEYIGAVIQQGVNYQSLPLISKTYDGGLNDEIVKYIENAINGATNGVNYGQAMKTASEGVAQVFTKYKVE